MHGDNIGAGLDEIGDVSFGMLYHQVDIQGQSGHSAD